MISLPLPVEKVLKALEAAGFQAFVVGGSVRDFLLGQEPKDWDITTNARPEEIQRLFPESVYENKFGTVGVKVARFQKNTSKTQEKNIIEVTTYRVESNYTDARHPDKVQFSNSLEQDLSRRDFTVNAMAAKIVNRNQESVTGEKETLPNYRLPITDYMSGSTESELEVVDPFRGRDDLKKKVIRAAGNAEERFGEDALRMLRAVRFVVELGKKQKDGSLDWKIEENTLAALEKLSGNIAKISLERVRDEFSRIILSPNPSEGIELLQKGGLLKHILPELELGIGVAQNLHHIYTVYEHNVRALATVPSNKLSVRLAALLHDVAKPHTKRGEGKYATFYNHDHVGARLTEKTLTRLRYPTAVIKKATLLVDNHLFYYNVGEVTEASVRRLIKRVGLENMDDLMAVRIGDRLGSGVPKAKPYKLRHLEYMIEKVSKDPLSVKMLALSGTDLMGTLKIPAGPKIGALLDVLLAEVIEDPGRNTREWLLSRAQELEKDDLEKLRERARDKIEEKKESEDEAIKKRHWVE